MHSINNHKVDEVKDLTIEAVDNKGIGNANHHYRISGFNTSSNASEINTIGVTEVDILFQNGTIPENGINGITNEALLAIVGDRLHGFQSGPFACDENTIALSYVGLALNALQKRTIQRIMRNVEGTHTV